MTGPTAEPTISWLQHLRLIMRAGNGLPYDDVIPADPCVDCDGPCPVCGRA